jgi:hypothetical protein
VNLALFDLAIDSKLRACDLVRLPMRDISYGNGIAARAIVMQQKTRRSVQFEITEQTLILIQLYLVLLLCVVPHSLTKEAS